MLHSFMMMPPETNKQAKRVGYGVPMSPCAGFIISSLVSVVIAPELMVLPCHVGFVQYLPRASGAYTISTGSSTKCKQEHMRKRHPATS